MNPAIVLVIVALSCGLQETSAAVSRTTRCLLPTLQVECKTASLEWRFDVDKGACIEFMNPDCYFPGQNSFATKAECRDICLPDVVRICNEIKSSVMFPGQLNARLEKLRKNDCL
ncbi:kunitz-type serine protease inhibitor Bt-KTI [Fopius arisanus]|uniref:Ambp protein n=1 Tax=Fopius arisanus TaxID=64838 RepID=A0A0C9R135_9HYME|nr:PREDICTED: kunitz-type serine protease inhibitor Bt-KTI-like [Fopius arisanus]